MVPTIAALPIVILTVALGILGLMAGVSIALWGKSEVGERIQHYIEAVPSDISVPEDEADAFMSRFRRQFNTFFAVLDSEEMERRLVAANWQITGSEFLFIRVGATLFVFLFGLLIFRNILPGIGLAVLGYTLPGFFLFRSIQERQKLFQHQLIDALTLIRGAVGAGYSFQQSINVVIQEMGSPTADEFRQVRRAVELGVPLSKALSEMASRMESDDFSLVASVVIINMQVGGNLTTILSVVTDTIRQRIALFSEMRALTAYAHFAGYLLTVLPFITVVILATMSPVYWNQLFQPGATRYVLIYAVCSLIVGNILLRRIARFRV